jgi:hypothetical protein
VHLLPRELAHSQFLWQLPREATWKLYREVVLTQELLQVLGLAYHSFSIVYSAEFSSAF